jgi:hypothetical protein
MTPDSKSPLSEEKTAKSSKSRCGRKKKGTISTSAKYTQENYDELSENNFLWANASS